MQRFIIKQNTGAGFTLVEMLVSLSLFTVVLTMSVGTLLVLIDANARAQNMQLVMSNLSFALDSMTREIRTGTDWYCDESANSPSIPTLNTDSTAATRDCGLSSDQGNYISVIESGGSLTGDTDSAQAQHGLGKAKTSRLTYYFDDNYQGRGAILRKLGTNSDSDDKWVALTGPEIDIEFVELSVGGTERLKHESSNGGLEQPTMTMYIRGKAGNDAAAKEFSLQTSVTQRSLDL